MSAIKIVAFALQSLLKDRCRISRFLQSCILMCLPTLYHHSAPLYALISIIERIESISIRGEHVGHRQPPSSM